MKGDAKRKLSDEQWKAIRASWEYDPDEPTFNEAAGRAGKKFGFTPPSKSTIDSRAKTEGWERRGNLNGINAAAQRKADALTGADGNRTQSDAPNGHVSSASDAKLDQAAREESEDKRAQVLARHREEWAQSAVLRQEAVAVRHHPTKNPTGDTAAAIVKAKFAKLIAETTHIQQVGERKAWGLDVVVDPDQLKSMSEEDLALLAAGKAPRGMR